MSTNKYQIISECLEKFHNPGVFIPIRLVWKLMNTCYICDKSGVECYSKYIIRGRHSGYQYCKKCACIVPIFKYMYEENGGYIPKKRFDSSLLTNIKFFRVSKSNINIKPYNHTGSWIDTRELQSLVKDPDKELCICVSWYDKCGQIIGKLVPLSNIIYYNRDKFNFVKENSILKNISSFWDKSIQKSYEEAYRPFILFRHIDSLHKNIDGLIKTKIIEYWKGDLI